MEHLSPQLLKLVSAAEREITPRHQSCLTYTKSDGSEVTKAKTRLKPRCGDWFQETYPSHMATLGAEDYVWVLDPIDGTKWFALGMPHFGILVALLEVRQLR